MSMNFLLLQLIAFSDEEEVRFHSTFLGSAALAGVLPLTALQISDKSARRSEGKIPINYRGKLVTAQVHIEQGPVLEWLGFPLGVVKGIAGQTRLKNFPAVVQYHCSNSLQQTDLILVRGLLCLNYFEYEFRQAHVTVKGSQGHAGIVPMSMRQDPMAAAAELMVLLESICKKPKDFLSYDGHCNDISLESLSSSLVCTVGEISTWPSASNDIPGQVTFTVDLRAIDGMGREAVIYELSNQMYKICERHSVSCIINRKEMAGDIQDETPTLMSGAGHDAMAMSHLTKVGMLFVQCRGGVSHSPAEHVLDEDVWAAGLAILAFLETQL
ncbi:allantoate deiminase 1-like [Castanea sativa]|uniref:allantoate deiminase 1-like n=1 Tax=Castanea sativa TaxID=21020 RepID=UPI003F65107F